MPIAGTLSPVGESHVGHLLHLGQSQSCGRYARCHYSATSACYLGLLAFTSTALSTAFAPISWGHLSTTSSPRGDPGRHAHPHGSGELLRWLCTAHDTLRS